uniref:SF3 helicase domain-containing protein n=1 Tax=viral metagenome TaxID=1070528 RepID=A0A6C0AF35_9ZZZZ
MISKTSDLIKKYNSTGKNLGGTKYSNVFGISSSFEVIQPQMNDFIVDYCKMAYDDEKMELQGDKKVGLNLGEVATLNTLPLMINFNMIFDCKMEECAFGTTTEDYYEDDFLISVTQVIQEIMIEKLIISKNNSELLCCVLESEPAKFNGNIYINLKFHFPYCQVDKKFQSDVMIPSVIEKLRENKIIEHMHIHPIDDWKKIILPSKNVIPLYRSKSEQHTNPLKLTRIYPIVEKKAKCEELILEDFFNPENYSLIKKNILSDTIFVNLELKGWITLLLSIYFCDTVCNPKNENIKKVYNKNYDLDESTDEEESVMDDDEDPKYLAPIFLGMLKSIRFTRTDYWIIVGKILFNIFDGDENGLELWTSYTLEFTKSEKAKDKCEMRYYAFRDSNFTIKTLARFARDDNKDEYEAWHNDWCNSVLEQSLSGIHNDVANFIYRVFWVDYIFTGEGKNPWYYFYKNTWKNTKKAMQLKQDIGNKIIMIFKDVRSQFTLKSLKNRKSNKKQKFENDQSIEDSISQITAIIKKLGTVGYKTSLVAMLEEKFNNDVFETEKNKNHLCTGWRNGVIECCGDTAFFREGIPEDYITMNTGLKYKADLSYDHPLVKELLDWLSKVFVDPELLEHFLKDSASHLAGKNSEKIMRVWTGATNGGKSMIMKLYKATFGQYCCDGPLSILTKTLPTSSGPNPELSQLRAAHICFFSEPDENDELQPGKIKRITGGDSFFARSCGEDGGSIDNYVSCILTTNDIPKMVNPDFATKERFSFLLFLSTFSLEAPEDEDEQRRLRIFKMDPFFDERIPELSVAFAWLIVEYYKNYKQKGLEKPKIMKDYAIKHWETNDPFIGFINERIVFITKGEVEFKFDIKNIPKDIDKSIKVNATDLYPAFGKWFRDNFPGSPVPSSTKFASEMKLKNRLGDIWRGIKVVNKKNLQ